MRNINKELHYSKIPYIVSWTLNIILFFIPGWCVVGIMLIARIFEPIKHLVTIFGALFIVIILNIIIFLIFYYFKLKFNKLIYWIVTISIALLPYIFLLLVFIDTYVRYGKIMI